MSLVFLASFVAVTTLDRPRIDPVPFTAVKLTDTFWAPRIETTRAVMIPACFKQCESTDGGDSAASAAR